MGAAFSGLCRRGRPLPAGEERDREGVGSLEAAADLAEHGASLPRGELAQVAGEEGRGADQPAGGLGVVDEDRPRRRGEAREGGGAAAGGDPGAEAPAAAMSGAPL